MIHNHRLHIDEKEENSILENTLVELLSMKELITLKRQSTYGFKKADRSLLKLHKRASKEIVKLSAELVNRGYTAQEISNLITQAKEKSSELQAI